MNCESMVLSVDKLTVIFGARAPLVTNFDLEVSAGQVVCLVGPSGAGKSTILRSIAQLQRYSGSVYVKDIDLSQCRPAQRSHLVGLVFQQGNLFANLTVLQNCAQPLMLLRGLARTQAEAAALQTLAHVGMDEYAARYPRELSGGQAQRVALVRALVLEPAVMLFDEPTAALDAENKDIVCRLIREYAARGKACVVTTHDRGVIEALDARVVTL